MPASKEKCVTDRHTQASEAIGEAWAFWLSQHPVSLGDIITDAVKTATGDWLAAHKDELLDRIAGEVAKGVPVPTPIDNKDAQKVLARWRKANESPADQSRLINDQERLWRLARDLATALGSPRPEDEDDARP